MQPLLINITGAQSKEEEIADFALQIGSLNEQVKTISNTIRYKIAAASKIREQLNAILTDMENEQTIMQGMSELLSQSVQFYLKTESIIIDTYEKVEATIVDGQRDTEIESSSESEFLDWLNTFFDVNGNPTVGMLRTLLLSIKDANMWKALQLLSQGKCFHFVTDNGRSFIKLIGGTNMTKQEVKEFMEVLTGSERWTKYDAKILRQKGIELLNHKNLNSTYERLFENGQYTALTEYLKGMQLRNATKIAKTFKAELKSGMKFWDDFNPSKYSELGKASKIAKGLSAAGTVIDFVTDFSDDFFEDGEFVVSGENMKEFVVDSAVSVSANVLTTAAGAAVGSIFIPPIGTVAGMAAGAVFGFFTNIGIRDFDGDGETDSIVDGIKYGANCAVDFIGDKAGEIIGEVGDTLEGVAEFLGDIF